MEAEQAAKKALEQRISRIKELRNEILGEAETIQDQIFPDYLNATPDVAGKGKILKTWNPMTMDLLNGLHVLTQGINAAEKIIKS